MFGRTRIALAIAGSDSGGGAGIQADLKAFARCGVHGTCAITALTAQNTVGVSAIHTVPPQIVLAQVRAVVEEIGVDAVKVGMLGSRETIEAVARALDELPAGTPVVVDPVMVAESGARLLDEGAERALIEEILPRAGVLTPNVPEARALLSLKQGEQIDARQMAFAIRELGPSSVVLTGGHRERAVDVLAAEGASQAIEIHGPRHADGSAHGSGCTHSSVLAACLARGQSLEQAARNARRLAGEAVGQGLHDVGAGAGPVDVLGLGQLAADLGGGVAAPAPERA